MSVDEPEEDRGMGAQMKTTIDIADSLFAEAKIEAACRGTTLRALVEEGLERVLREPRTTATFRMRDCSVGGGWSDAWERMSPDEKVAAMYGSLG
jgi:hypothetical protein